MTTVKIKELAISTILGTKPSERIKKQKILIDFSFSYNAQKASKNDDLSFAVDYEHLSKTICQKVSASKFFLAEALAEFILNILLTQPRIKKASVTVHKSKAIKNAQGISVHISNRNTASKS